MARPPHYQNGDAGAVATTAVPPVADVASSGLVSVLDRRRADVLEAWIRSQTSSRAYLAGRVSDTAIRAESSALLSALHRTLQAGAFGDADNPAFAELTRLLVTMSKDRARQDYSPSETASAVFSLKDAFGPTLQEMYGGDPGALVREIAELNRLVDVLGLQTFEAFAAGREEVVRSQQQSLLELSTPVVKLWDGIVAVPLIGTLDSGRTQTVMENLLQAIVDTESQVAIIDITGVFTVDTLVAQHLLKTVAATRLMGADCIISGIRPQIAQTMVHLGVELSDVVTKATLADAFRVAIERVGVNGRTFAKS